jgi:hypothetical protein
MLLQVEPLRKVTGELRSARRCPPKYTPKASSAMAKLGLSYERKIVRDLMRSVWLVEHNPWFEFQDELGVSTCCPDIILTADSKIIVIEVKLTWVPEAIEKLRGLYCPVVEYALAAEVFPLIIVKNLRPDAPPVQDSVQRALESEMPILQWIGSGHIPWL